MSHECQQVHICLEEEHVHRTVLLYFSLRGGNYLGSTIFRVCHYLLCTSVEFYEDKTQKISHSQALTLVDYMAAVYVELGGRGNTTINFHWGHIIQY